MTVTIVVYAKAGSYREAAGFGCESVPCDGWREGLDVARYYRDGGHRVHVRRPEGYYGTYPAWREFRTFAAR